MGIRVKKEISSPVSALNIFENDNLSIFYKSKEILSVYFSSYSMKGQITEQVVNILEFIANNPFTEDEQAHLDQILSELKKAKTEKVRDSSETLKDLQSMFKTQENNLATVIQENVVDLRIKGIFNLLKFLSPEGVNLLAIKGDINLKELTKCYKESAKKHHPDRGGSTEVMQKLNQTFALFQDAILNYKTEPFYPQNILEYIFAVKTVLASVYGSQYAADKSFQQIKDLKKIKDKISDESIEEFLNTITNFNAVISSPSWSLGRMKMKSELVIAAEFAEKMSILKCRNAKSRYGIKVKMSEDEISLSPFEFEPVSPLAFLPNKKDLLKESNQKLSINTAEQANNAFRLGAIKESRHLALLKKFSSLAIAKENEISTIRSFIESQSLQVSFNDFNYELPPKKPVLVRKLEYDKVRFNDLDESQKYEYLSNYYALSVDSSIHRYARVRAIEIMTGLIHNYAKFNFEKALKETEFFSQFVSFSSFRQVNSLLKHFASLEKTERLQKISILKVLDDPQYDPFQPSSFELFPGESMSYEKQIMLVNDCDKYIDFATSSISDIEKFQKTGEFTSANDSDWERDLKSLEKFDNSKIGKNRNNDGAKSASDDPAGFIRSHLPYVEGLIELGKKFNPRHTGELQIGYCMNALTTAYAKIGNWEECEKWSQLFFDLPEEYRERSNSSEQASLKKRLERAKKMLSE